MALYDNEFARRTDTGLVARPGPTRLNFRLGPLIAADGHHLDCELTFAARLLDDPAERQMFQEAFRTGFSVSNDQLIDHFRPQLRAAAVAAAEKQPGQHWLEPAGNAAVTAALLSAAKAVAFACGLDIIPPFRASLQSPTLEQQRIDALRRVESEKRVAAQAAQFEKASEMLRTFDQMKQAQPDLSVADALRQLPPAQQGHALASMMFARGQEMPAAATVWAAVGNALARIDLDFGSPASQASPSPAAPLKPDLKLFPMPDAAGPLRSVCCAKLDGNDVLLVGARTGVLIVDPQNPAAARLFTDPQTDSPLGFNHVIIFHDKLIATHRDAGVVFWDIATGRISLACRPGDLGQPPPPMRPPVNTGISATIYSGSIVRPGQTTLGARNLQPLDASRILLSNGGALLAVNEQGDVTPIGPPASTDIAALLTTHSRIIVIHEDGLVRFLSRAGFEETSRQRPGGKVQAAALLSILSDDRLLLSTEAGPLICAGLDDGVVIQYQSPYRALRGLATSDTLIAAVTPERQRLVFWRPWAPASPAGEFALSAVARHRIADVAVAPSA